ncbi:MAG: PD-(D/E)XK nuclease family protein [Treponema sp.]|nr:PD-(D/E)XK nuclease family protein [Treponema sp.]
MPINITEKEIIDFVHDGFSDKYVAFCKSGLKHITNEYVSAIESAKKMYGMLESDTFNFFEPLERYYKEDFHDIMLFQILNPKTKGIGNIEYLNTFCKLLSEKTDYCFGREVVVERQKGHIDILISDEKNAIIIENKINNAPDRPNQLARYLRYVEGTKKKKVVAIVYIRPICDDSKLPPLKDYDATEYSSEIARIKELLVPITVIDSKGKNDLCHFLDSCAGFTEHETAKVYIKQYSELLKLNGGNKMLEGMQKEVIMKLYSDEESVKKILAIGEIWDNRGMLFAPIIKDSLFRIGFKQSEDEEFPLYENYTEKNIDKKIFIAFYDDGTGHFWFGFRLGSSVSKKVQDSLENLLKNSENNLLTDIGNEHGMAIGGSLKEVDQPIEGFLNSVIAMCQKLEKLAANIVKK